MYATILYKIYKLLKGNPGFMITINQVLEDILQIGSSKQKALWIFCFQYYIFRI